MNGHCYRDPYAWVPQTSVLLARLQIALIEAVKARDTSVFVLTTGEMLRATSILGT